MRAATRSSRQQRPRGLSWLAALAALTFPLASAIAADALTIRLHDQVSVSRGTVTLGDIATLTGADAPVLQRLAAIDIGPAPAAGTTVVLTRPVLEAWVRRSLRRAPETATPSLQWQGADTASIERRSQWVEADALEAVARRALSHHAIGATSPGLVQALQRLRVPAGRLGLDARPIANGAASASRVTVWIDITVDDLTVASLPAVFAIDDARAGLDVRQGDSVRLFSRSGTVKVEMVAQALQGGRTGQAIRVRGASAEAAVLATVMRAGEVEMLP